MPFLKGKTGVNNNPLLETPFYQQWEDAGINPPPPDTALMITEILSDYMQTESGDYMITE